MLLTSPSPMRASNPAFAMDKAYALPFIHALLILSLGCFRHHRYSPTLLHILLSLIHILFDFISFCPLAASATTGIRPRAQHTAHLHQRECLIAWMNAVCLYVHVCASTCECESMCAWMLCLIHSPCHLRSAYGLTVHT